MFATMSLDAQFVDRFVGTIAKMLSARAASRIVRSIGVRHAPAVWGLASSPANRAVSSFAGVFHVLQCCSFDCTGVNKTGSVNDSLRVRQAGASTRTFGGPRRLACRCARSPYRQPSLTKRWGAFHLMSLLPLCSVDLVTRRT